MKKGTLIVAASIVAILAMLFVFSRFFVDLFWFSSIGLRRRLHYTLAHGSRCLCHRGWTFFRSASL